MTKVLLTGGSGFVASHILEILIQRGYHVVTTARSQDKADSILSAFLGAELTVSIVPDMAVDGAFDDVAQTPGLDYVLHTASPFHFNWSDAKSELLDPAIKGTTSILNSIHTFAPGVKRVVVTSSFVSMITPGSMQDVSKVFDESDWNPITYEEGLKGDKATAYRASKTLAERSAWSFVDDTKPKFDLTTLCPPLVFGPVAHWLQSLTAINTSNQRFVDLLQGRWKDEILPTLGVNFFVDVRDLAFAHVAAMERKEAGGRRFLCSGGRFCNREIVDAARVAFPQLKELIPAVSVQGGGYPLVMPRCDNSSTTKILGVEWISIEKCTVDTIESMLSVAA